MYINYCIYTYVLCFKKDRSVESGDERPKEMSDLDDTYWEPADSINELYKQLSSNKYREIPPHQVKYASIIAYMSIYYNILSL